MKPLLLTLTALFCISPIQTNAVTPVFVTVSDGGCYVEDSKGEEQLKRLTIDMIEDVL